MRTAVGETPLVPTIERRPPHVAGSKVSARSDSPSALTCRGCLGFTVVASTPPSSLREPGRSRGHQERLGELSLGQRLLTYSDELVNAFHYCHPGSALWNDATPRSGARHQRKFCDQRLLALHNASHSGLASTTLRGSLRLRTWRTYHFSEPTGTILRTGGGARIGHLRR